MSSPPVTGPSPDELAAGAVVSTGRVALDPVEPDPSDIVTGTPSTAARALFTYDGVEIGLWEMTEGGMTDVEADELFVVLGGSATVVIDADGSTDARRLEIGPGDAVRLTAGMRTTWTVHATLRKLYVAPSAAP